MIYFLITLLHTSEEFFFSSTSDEPSLSKNHPSGNINLYKELFTDNQKENLLEFRAGLFGVSMIEESL